MSVLTKYKHQCKLNVLCFGTPKISYCHRQQTYKNHIMRAILTTVLFLITIILAFGQNQNVSNGNIFDGEPYLSINPSNSQHMVVAWMGYLPFTKVLLKTKVSFNAGQTWSNMNPITHTNPVYGSADPSIEFDNSGNVFLSYIDYSSSLDSGAVYVTKSTDGGLNWGSPIKVINAHSDVGKYPIDRPWISIDRSGGVNDGNIYITTMSPNVFGPILPPYHPYFMVSTDGGNSYSSWVYLDTTNWLAGNTIGQPMPTNCVSSNGTFHAIYPSYLISQSFFAQFIIASTSDAGNSFSYNSVLLASSGITDTLSKKGYLLRSNPTNANHLAFFYLDITHGDIDIFMKESFDEGLNWSAATRINDDPIANNRMQDLMWADFDNDGDLVVSWRDRRNGTDSTYTTSSEIWASVRNKDSINFSANFQISDNSVAYDSILAYAGNDFMCIKLVDDTLSAVWGDTRDGKLNIWFQRMSLDGIIISSQQISSEDMPNIRIFPNPTTTIVNIESENLIQIAVYDISGNKIITKRNENGIGKIKINLKNYPTGIYLIEVTTSKGIKTKRIIKG